MCDELNSCTGRLAASENIDVPTRSDPIRFNPFPIRQVCSHWAKFTARQTVCPNKVVSLPSAPSCELRAEHLLTERRDLHAVRARDFISRPDYLIVTLRAPLTNQTFAHPKSLNNECDCAPDPNSKETPFAVQHDECARQGKFSSSSSSSSQNTIPVTFAVVVILMTVMVFLS